MVSTAYELATAYDISRKELVFADADDPVRKIAQDFITKNIGSMIVISGNEYIGIITDDTIFQAIHEGIDLLTAKVKDLRLDPIHTIRKDASLSEVSQLFASTGASRLGVEDEEGKIVAVVKKKNLELLDRFNFVDRAHRRQSR